MSDRQQSIDQGDPAEEVPGNDDEGVESLGFGEALEEIESILGRIEDDEVDIDQLAEELGRAARLLEVCRAKIRRAEDEVEVVAQKLSPDEEG